MSIERLSFSSENDYNAIELAIHLARYSTAQNLCKGLDVLDVACGEGYGSFAMASFWNAKSVTGVDISEEAIQTAQNVFSHPNVKYTAAAAEKIDELFEKNSFDMVVSLETIEHVKNPDIFLSAIKKVLKPNGILILSCPNDHWYYGPGESENPFHLRTYYFNEFKELAESHFGGAYCYLLGKPIAGFGNFLWSEQNTVDLKATMHQELLNSKLTQVNQISSDEPVLTDDCSFFVGVWGNPALEKEQLVNCTFFSTSMDKFSLTLEDNNKYLESQLNALKANLENLEKQNKDFELWLNTSQNRIIDLEKWTVELQAVNRNSQNRILELDNFIAELQNRILESDNLKIELQNRISDFENRTDKLRLNLTESNNNLKISQSELKNSKNTIRLMEESKFWKIRNQWFSLKNNLRSKKNNK